MKTEPCGVLNLLILVDLDHHVEVGLFYLIVNF